MVPSWKNDVGKAVKHHLSKLKTKDSSSCQLPVALLINMEGVKVVSPDGRDLIMAHALRKILYCTVDTKKHLFAIVSSNPDTGPEGIHSHVFVTAKKDQANEINELIGKAFKASFTKKSLRKRKQKIKETAWKVVSPEQPPHPPPSSAPATSPEQPLPSAPPLILSPPPSSPAYNRDHLLAEAGQLEADIGRLQARVAEIGIQLQEVASIEEAVMQLTVQLSAIQQQIEERRQRLAFVQQEIHVSGGMGHQAVGGMSSQPFGGMGPQAVGGMTSPGIMSPPGVNPPSYEGLYPNLDVAGISLEDAEWFQEGLPREIAMEILSFQPEGGFIVRRSNSSPGNYALSLKAPQGKIVHFLIENVPIGVKLQNCPTTFPSLVDLIHHLTVNKETLPCTLSMDTSNPSYLGGRGAAAPDSDSDTDDADFGNTSHQYHLLS